MSTEKMEWVEIIEPKTQEHMYANLRTGECVWDLPLGVPVKKRDDNQWWELFDSNTSRFYYYNATTQKTVWHRPSNCDIIPLAKLQTLKQHAEALSISSDPEEHLHTGSSPASNNNNNNNKSPPTPAPRETVATQTSSGNSAHVQTAHVTSIKSVSSSKNQNHVSNNFKSPLLESNRNGGVPPSHHRPSPSHHNKAMVTMETQTSPLSPRRSHHHHHHHSGSGRLASSRRNNQTSGSGGSKPAQSHDSGRSTDSNCSTSLAAQSTPPSLATSTPLLKKKTLGGGGGGGGGEGGNLLPTPAPRAIQRSSSTANPSHAAMPSRQKSFDINISIGGGYSLGHDNRTCGSMSRTPRATHAKPTGAAQISRSQSFAQGGAAPHPSREERFSGGSAMPRDGGNVRADTAMPGEEEDSMHEKYFLSSVGGKKLESSSHSTPQSRRKQLSQSASQGSVTPSTPDYVNFTTPPPPPPSSTASYHSRSSSNSSTLHPAPSVPPLPVSYPYQKSPSLASSKLRSASSRLKESGLSSSEEEERSSSMSLSSSPPTAATPPRRKPSPLPPSHPHPHPHPHTHLSDINLDLSIPSSRPSSELRSHPSSDRVSSTPSGGKVNNNDRSPLYTNTALASNDGHLLPLHQYILEQAKLSGCYRFGDPLSTEEDADTSGNTTGSAPGRRYLTGDEALVSEDENEGDLRLGLGGLSSLRNLRLLRVEYDSDEFADDEGMSAASEDSSSQEYLDEDCGYLHEEYAARFRPDAGPPTAAPPGSAVTAPPGPGAKPWNFASHADGGRMCDYTVVDDGSGASSHYYNTTASLLRPSQLGGPNQFLHHHQTSSGSPGIPLETQHASLKRRKDPVPPQPIALYSPILEARSEQQMPRALDKDLLTRGGRFTPMGADIDGLYAPPAPGTRIYEKYAPDNLNIHKKGLFRKNLSVKDMLSWSTDPISQPMTVLPDKTLKKEARDLFKLVQIYMGDRKTKVGMFSNTVALEICTLGYSKPALRDELYIQICKQTSENPRKESLRRGWELMAVCLAFFPPSPRLQGYLDSYMNRHRNPHYDFPEVGKWPIHIQVSHYASVACKRLERGGVGGKRPPRKPSVDEIEQAKMQIFRPSMFGSTLGEVMSLQRDKFPHHRLPWIQTTLSEQVLRLGGKQTEGIFRVSADMDEVTCLKLQLDRWDLPQSPLLDAHTPASLLKLWYRELYEPLIPDTLYSECVTHCEAPGIVLKLVERLPELNRLVLSYLIHFLQMFAKPDVVQMTKMDANNLAMVMAPNCLRCTSSDPHVIFDNARKEMAFMRTLIQHLDTRFIEEERVF